MIAYALIAIGLVLLAAQGTGLLTSPLAAALFPLPVAAQWLRGSRGRSAGLVCCAALAGLWRHGHEGPGALAMAMVFAAFAASGCMLGESIRRRWSFGACVAVTVLSAYGVSALWALLRWEQFHAWWTVFSNARVAELEQRAVDSVTGQEAAVAETMRFLDLNWPHLGLGILFVAVLAPATVAVAVFARGRQLRGEPAPKDRFRDMRPPDWLIWAVIAVAACWFLDRYRPNEALRAVSWNGAVALAALYWLNGFSILLYVLAALRVRPLLHFAVIFMVIALSGHPLLGALGLFDTWWDIRRKADRIIERRQLRDG